MITETREIYKCEFCRKLYQLKRFCILHEERCSKNPENNRICFDCKHLASDEEEFYYDTPMGEQCRMVHAFSCSKMQTYLIPPNAEHKGNRYEFGGEWDNVPMKKKCEGFEAFDHLKHHLIFPTDG